MILFCIVTYRVFIKFFVFFRIFQNIPNSVIPRCQFVYTKQAGRKQALLQNWQSSEKSQNFKEKTQYLMNTLYVNIGRSMNPLERQFLFKFTICPSVSCTNFFPVSLC